MTHSHIISVDCTSLIYLICRVRSMPHGDHSNELNANKKTYPPHNNYYNFNGFTHYIPNMWICLALALPSRRPVRLDNWSFVATDLHISIIYSVLQVSMYKYCWVIWRHNMRFHQQPESSRCWRRKWAIDDDYGLCAVQV